MYPHHGNLDTFSFFATQLCTVSQRASLSALLFRLCFARKEKPYLAGYLGVLCTDTSYPDLLWSPMEIHGGQALSDALCLVHSKAIINTQLAFRYHESFSRKGLAVSLTSSPNPLLLLNAIWLDHLFLASIFPWVNSSPCVGFRLPLDASLGAERFTRNMLCHFQSLYGTL